MKKLNKDLLNAAKVAKETKAAVVQMSQEEMEAQFNQAYADAKVALYFDQEGVYDVTLVDTKFRNKDGVVQFLDVYVAYDNLEHMFSIGVTNVQLAKAIHLYPLLKQLGGDLSNGNFKAEINKFIGSEFKVLMYRKGEYLNPELNVNKIALVEEQ